MARVTVRLFAALRELAGAARVEAEGATVGELVEALSGRYGERFAGIAAVGSVVVDGERAEPATELAEGQEVALLPPVSGGYRRADPP
ncbi:MAG TPA: MoaD/ThiS family protein [Actinomycetota bacterium]|nr:MoaD/ThiS family protein [Actinomycetota bacterium]